jgi:hypothetical protein
MGACADSGKDSLYEHSALLAGDSAAYRRNSVYAAGSVPTFSTILASYPLRDAICILIFLLCLPPSLVVVVQSLFAVLHFVPQNAGLSLSTLTNIKEIFNASNVGYPAVATSLFIDLVFWVLWLPLWKPIQCIILDLSQAAIAISLSGPAASNVGPTYSIATCAIAVCMVHVLRYRAIHLTALDYLRSVIHKIGINFQFEMPFFATSFYSSSAIERGWPFTIVRTILGIHIFAQGIKACIRHTLVKANEKDADLTLPKVDPEQSSAADTTPSRLNIVTTDSVQQPHTAPSTDGRPPGPSPALRAASFRDSNHKKKRKQANQVRNQQPLWASIARTKVTWLKEMEQREAADDAREAALTDNNTNFTLANTTTTTTTPPLTAAPTLIDRIWIYEVRDTEIHFGVDLSVTSATATSEDHRKADVLPSAIDRLKPFFIRVNGAIWSSTRIHAMPTSESASLQTPHHFIGEIFGLAPLSSYHCEVVSIARRMPLCSARLITRATPTAEQVSATPPPPQQPTLRPSSPRTTLKQSIQSAESKLHEARNRARKAKKDQRAAHAHVKNEISKFRSALENSSANDEKHERRLLQISQHKKQAEEATAELKTQVDSFGETPAAEQAKYNSKKGIYNAGLQAKKAATQELDGTKSALDKDLNSVKSEISSAEDRSEKLTAKINQRAQEVENMLVKQQADQAAQQKRDTDRGNVYLGRQNKEQEIRYMISSLEHEMQTHSRKAQEVWHEISALQHWPSQAQHANYPSGNGNNNNNFASPSPPDSMGSNNGSMGPPPSNGFPSTNNNPSYAHQSFQPSLLSAAPLSNSSFAPRGRSSSMLSQYSGFTDNGDDFSPADPQPPRHAHTWTAYPGAAAATENRKPSDGEVFENVSSFGGSGGGSSLTNGSTNGSSSPRPDAKPFVPTNGAVMAGKKGDWISPGAIGSGR